VDVQKPSLTVLMPGTQLLNIWFGWLAKEIWREEAFPYTSDTQPVFRGTPVCHEIFTSHYNYNHNAIKRYVQIL
jgi:hypothetical protein